MCRLVYRWALTACVGGTCLLACAADPTADAAKLAELRKKPITTAKGELGDLLTQWWKDGTAAGNAGDFYDNRDGDHSDLNTEPYPQLQRIVYSAEDVKARRHWALTVATRPHVTFGNSSTSAPPTMGGSNPRHAYCSPKGLALPRQAVHAATTSTSIPNIAITIPATTAAATATATSIRPTRRTCSSRKAPPAPISRSCGPSPSPSPPSAPR